MSNELCYTMIIFIAMSYNLNSDFFLWWLYFCLWRYQNDLASVWSLYVPSLEFDVMWLEVFLKSIICLCGWEKVMEFLTLTCSYHETWKFDRLFLLLFVVKGKDNNLGFLMHVDACGVTWLNCIPLMVNHMFTSIFFMIQWNMMVHCYLRQQLLLLHYGRSSTFAGPVLKKSRLVTLKLNVEAWIANYLICRR